MAVIFIVRNVSSNCNSSCKDRYWRCQSTYNLNSYRHYSRPPFL